MDSYGYGHFQNHTILQELKVHYLIPLKVKIVEDPRW
jgi:hypothetical protein